MKVVYDLLLWRAFCGVRPPEEVARAQAASSPRRSSMPVPVVRVRQVRVVMDQRGMAVKMAVRLTHGVGRRVMVLVVFIVHVCVFVLDGVMYVTMAMSLE
jgi:hypothetical protein